MSRETREDKEQKISQSAVHPPQEKTPKVSHERESPESALHARVLALASEYVHTNRVLLLRTFLPFVQKHLRCEAADDHAVLKVLQGAHYERQNKAIEEAVQALIQRGEIVEGRKIIPGLLLKHPRRRAILEFVTAHPGVSLKHIQADLEGGVASLYNHLRYLVNFDHLRVVRFPKQKHYFPYEFPRGTEIDAIVAHKPKYRRILATLQEGAATQGELARMLGKHKSTIQYRLQGLIEHGLVDIQRVGRAKHYTVSDPARVKRIVGRPGTGRAGKPGH